MAEDMVKARPMVPSELWTELVSVLLSNDRIEAGWEFP